MVTLARRTSSAYDLDRFPERVIDDVLKTHPRMLVDNTVFENPHYTDPAEFLAQMTSSVG